MVKEKYICNLYYEDIEKIHNEFSKNGEVTLVVNGLVINSLMEFRNFSYEHISEMKISNGRDNISLALTKGVFILTYSTRNDSDKSLVDILKRYLTDRVKKNSLLKYITKGLIILSAIYIALFCYISINIRIQNILLIGAPAALGVYIFAKLASLKLGSRVFSFNKGTTPSVSVKDRKSSLFTRYENILLVLSSLIVLSVLIFFSFTFYVYFYLNHII